MGLLNRNMLAPIGAFLGGIVAKLEASPEAAGPLADAKAAAQDAEAALAAADAKLKAAIPGAAKFAVNTIMDLFPPDEPFEPLADALIDEICAQLLARKSRTQGLRVTAGAITGNLTSAANITVVASPASAQ